MASSSKGRAKTRQKTAFQLKTAEITVSLQNYWPAILAPFKLPPYIRRNASGNWMLFAAKPEIFQQVQSINAGLKFSMANRVGTVRYKESKNG
jgi:hypothetical protein